MKRVLTLFLVVLAPNFVAAPAAGQSVTIHQLNLDVDSGVSMYSDWGMAELEFVGSSSILYFNLLIGDGDWQVINVPVHSAEGSGLEQSVTFDFSLGVAPGTDLDDVDIAWDLTDSPLTGFARGQGRSERAAVQETWVRLFSGEDGVPILAGPAEPLEGGGADGDKKTNPEFPNQECGAAECVPAAVSNSLKWLNTKHDLGMDDADITIEKMKVATGWIEDWGAPGGWWDTKDTYMENNDLPIETSTTNDPAVAKEKLGEDCDVELGGSGHRAAVVGISKNDDGKWTLTVVHDTKQGEEGGTKKETVILDPSNGRLKGGKFFDGGQLINFVIECPREDTAVQESDWGEVKRRY